MKNTRIALPYRGSDYFNEVDDFIFYDDHSFFQSKVHWYNGAWYTNKGLSFKATTLRALRVKSEKEIHQTIGLYQCYTVMGVYPMSFKTNGVDPGDLLFHIEYNLNHRWGRALIIDEEIIYTGALSMDDCQKFIEEYTASPMYVLFTKCTAPYH